MARYTSNGAAILTASVSHSNRFEINHPAVTAIHHGTTRNRDLRLGNINGSRIKVNSVANENAQPKSENHIPLSPVLRRPKSNDVAWDVESAPVASACQRSKWSTTFRPLPGYSENRGFRRVMIASDSTHQTLLPGDKSILAPQEKPERIRILRGSCSAGLRQARY